MAGMSPVPLVRVIANPSAYLHKYVGLCGFFVRTPDGAKLYTSTESSSYMTADAIDVKYGTDLIVETGKSGAASLKDPGVLNERFVFISGQITAGGDSGAVINATRIAPLRKRAFAHHEHQ